jgi:hypothetical protein
MATIRNGPSHNTRETRKIRDRRGARGRRRVSRSHRRDTADRDLTDDPIALYTTWLAIPVNDRRIIWLIASEPTATRPDALFIT